MASVATNVYKIEEEIGSGKYGTVYRVSKKGKIYALKKMDKQFQRAVVKKSAFALDEMSRLRSVRHPFLIRFFKNFRGKPPSESVAKTSLPDLGPEFYIVMEFCAGHNMKTKIEAAKHQAITFSLVQIELCLVQLLMAVAHLHHIGIVHREIKPNNIFILDDDFKHVKLGDFSFVKALDLSENVAISSSRRERESYRAPELWQGKIMYCNVDEWSLGCVVYELITLKPPFSSNNVENIVIAKYEPIPAEPSDNSELIFHMNRLLTPNPEYVECGFDAPFVIGHFLDISLASDRPHAVQILQGPAGPRMKHAINEARRIYVDELAHIASTSANPLQYEIPVRMENDNSALDVDTQGNYPPQSWRIQAEDSLARHTWRNMVDGYGDSLPFRPYLLSSEYDNCIVLIWLVRPDADWKIPHQRKNELSLFVQTINPPRKRLRLGFKIVMQFPVLNGDPFDFEEDYLDAMANTDIKRFYHLEYFEWDECDREQPPSAIVHIMPEWV